MSSVLKSPPASLEEIKLKLIQNRPYTHQDSVLSPEIVSYLLKALEYADGPFTAEIETLLTKAGTSIIPDLVKGLFSSHLAVKSTCAMVLIRMGVPAAKAVEELYHRQSYNPEIRWVAEFILDELRVFPQQPSFSMTSSVEIDQPVLQKAG